MFLEKRVKKQMRCFRSIPLALSGTGVEFTKTYAFAKKKRLNCALSYNFEILKGMSHNLELKLSENVWFVEVYQKNESVTAIRARTDLKGC